MNIYIPSMGRPNLQRTFTRLTPALQEKTQIVIPPEEYRAYVSNWPKENILVCHRKGIARTRNFILDHARTENTRKIVMLDDDLIFQRLRPDGKITNSTPEEVKAAFVWLEEILDGFTHAGFSVRFSDKGGGQTDKSPARMMHVLAYNLKDLPQDVAFNTGAEDNGTFSMDDFNMTLQLLTRGIPNIVSSEWRTSPAAGNARGGASTWRTLETQNASARRLHELFPNYVALRAKNNWQGIEGGQMWDVTVQWKRAYEEAEKVLGPGRIYPGTWS